MKKCTKCGKVKGLGEFSKKSTNKDGLSCWCKECYKAYRKAYRKANKEKLAEYQKAYYEVNKEEFIAMQKAYYEANKEYFAEYKKAYREANKEELAEYQKAGIQNLEDWYVAKLLGLPLAECPKELIETKKIQVKIHRLVNS